MIVGCSSVDVQIGQWNPCGQQNASKERTVKYDISARLPVGVKTSAVTEKQVRPCSTYTREVRQVQGDNQCLRVVYYRRVSC